MRIARIQVRNFKSFLDSGEVELKPGFNVITGQNSAGKTALLEAMTLQFSPSPHRSLRTVGFPGAQPSVESVVRVTFSLGRDELFRLMGESQHQLPLPQQGFPIPGNRPYQARATEGPFLAWLSREPEFSVSLQLARWPAGERFTAEGPPLGKYPMGPRDSDGNLQMLSVFARDGQEFALAGFARAVPTDYLPVSIVGPLRARIYRFVAERFNVGQCPFGNNSTLAPNAQNLPEAINTLKANPERFRRLNELVCKILPQIRQVSVRAVPGGNVQIIIWPHDPTTQREDLAIPLSECGSGVGQVLAIMYVVMTSDHPQVILVDEPQSFLHPGAVRKLIDVLKQYPQHQYIFSTHSPGVITAAEPATLTVARFTDGGTSLQPIDPTSAKDLQAYLSELGARLSDVFGADNVLWVEGQTEEACSLGFLAC